jgi:hypothetical protein
LAKYLPSLELAFQPLYFLLEERFLGMVACRV